VLLPHLSAFASFLTLNAAIGFASGVGDTAVHVWMLQLWGQANPPFIQALHFCWAAGSIVAPLISRPFLTPMSQLKVNNTVPILADKQVLKELVESRLAVPYGITGGLAIFGGSLIFFLYIWTKYFPSERKSTEKEDEKTDETKKPSIGFIIANIGLGSILLCSYCASEMTFYQYLATFVVRLDLGLTKYDGSLVLSCFATMFTIGRFVGIPMALKMKPINILWLDVILLIIGNFLLLFSNQSSLFLWGGTSIMGFGYAAFFPAVFSHLKSQFEITGLMAGVLQVFALSGNALGFPILIGKHINSKPFVLIFGNLGCLIAVTTVLAILQIIPWVYEKIAINTIKKNAKVIELEF